MAEPPKKPEPKSNELASRIYVDLIGRTLVLGEGSVKMPVSAENLAKLSIKLAEAFEQVEKDIADAAAPAKAAYKLDADDIAAWMK
jgi:hypothetical protein